MLVQCKEALDLSKELVSKWLFQYMFKGTTNAQATSSTIAGKLANHPAFKTHSRHIDRTQAQSMGLIIDPLEKDQEFQDLVLSVFHATAHMFNGTNAVKIIENQLGRAYVKSIQPIVIAQAPRPAAPPQEKLSQPEKTIEQPK